MTVAAQAGKAVQEFDSPAGHNCITFKINNIMIDLNEFYAQYCANQEKTKFEMAQTAAREIFKAVQKGYYSFQDLKELNFSEICDWCGWPDFGDGGVFEQAIKTAANMVCSVLGYKPQH